ncbi:AmmeMemoRadiSam system protein A [Candidatus Falkowbacteria bacterium]|nr:AmmeMemoRadiSam system protein A [Candidatus Falkowbacteria bacterium]
MSAYVKLAKEAVEVYIKTGKIISPPNDLPKKFLTSRAGIFVSIYNGEELRGCIGTYLPTEPNLAGEIIGNAVAAATRDYRFQPITEKELAELSYSVYVLEEPHEIKNLDELNPKKYGILIKSETGKSGLLLPDLEGINTTEEQLSAVCRKCGVRLNEEKITIYKFAAKKYQD